MINKKVAYSILDLAVIPQGSSVAETYDDSIRLAQEAEQNGFTRYWFAEHHNMTAIASNAPQILIGRIAQATQTIRVGSGGIMLPNHSPLIISEQFATLAILFPNRIDLGLGRAPGTDQDTAHAIRAGFIQAAHSFPADINQIQDYFSIDNQDSRVRAPLAEGVEVPIYILGSSADSAHLAARKGLPYAFASHFAPTHLFSAMEIYRTQFKPSDALSQPYVIAGVNVIIADTHAEAERLSTSLIKLILGILTGKRKDYLAEAEDMTDELASLRQHPQVSQMMQYSFVGDKASVKNQIQEFLKHTQVDELIAVSHIHDQKARLKSYGLLADIMKEINTEEIENKN